VGCEGCESIARAHNYSTRVSRSHSMGGGRSVRMPAPIGYYYEPGPDGSVVPQVGSGRVL